ncbi:hypothetical protein X766_33905 [Mesorhizobium sp. LSJC255A00]|nr:hypothetical protein X766_33905 [Mesorhizobium sp. LSJC255A00]
MEVDDGKSIERDLRSRLLDSLKKALTERA